MKKLNKKGFTLVELLAVIVVLAIIMLIAVNSVIPMINDTKKGAFASSANIIVSAVESKHLIDMVNGESKNCYTVAELVNGGYVTKISAGSTGFEGKVVVSTDANDKNIYTITLIDHKTDNWIKEYNTNNGPVDSKIINPTGETAPTGNLLLCQ